MTQDQWNYVNERDKIAGAVEYNQAWAMCHMLVYAADQGKPKYRARFLDLLQRMLRRLDLFLQLRRLQGSCLRHLQPDSGVCSVNERNPEIVVHAGEHAAFCRQIVQIARKV